MSKILFICSVLVLSSCSQLSLLLPDRPTKNNTVFKSVWSKNLDPAFDAGNLPIALQSPETDDGIVYVGDNKGYMHAFELENGRNVWSAFDGSEFHSSPVVSGDKLIYGTVEGRVIARNVKDGSKVYYNVDLGSPIETKGTVYNGKILFQLRNHQVFCLDVETGKILWGFKKSVSYLTTLQRASAPVVFNNKVYVGFADGNLSVLSLDEGVLVYEVKLSDASKFLDVDSNPFFLNNKLYIGSQTNNAMMLEPNTGKIVRKAEFTTLRSPVAFKDQLIYGSTEGELIVSDLNLNVVKKLKLSTAPLSSIVIYKDLVVVGNLKGQLFAVNLDSFKMVETFSFGHSYSAIFSDLVVKDNYLLALSSRNRLFIFH